MTPEGASQTLDSNHGATRATEYFERLDAQAQPLLEEQAVLEQVQPNYGRGWLLIYSSPEGFKITVEANPDLAPSAARSDHFGFSYRKSPAAGDAQYQWESNVGFLLAKTLASVDVGAPPASVLSGPEEAAKPVAPTITLTLNTDCDRGCRFCGWGAAKTGSSPSGVSPLLPKVFQVANTLDSIIGKPLLAAQRRRMEARLRRTWEEAPETVLSWSGYDCLASPNFDHLLRFAHDLGFRGMYVQSPGSRLADEATLDFLAQHSVEHFCLTAHASTPATFDDSAGKSGAKDLFWRAMTLLLARKLPVMVTVPCYTHNVHELGMVLRDLQPHPVTIGVFFWYPEDLHRKMFTHLPMKHDVAVKALAEVATWMEPGRVAVDGIPACAVPLDLKEHFLWNYPGHHLDSTSFEHVETCDPCPERDNCPGFARVYSEEFLQTPSQNCRPTEA